MYIFETPQDELLIDKQPQLGQSRLLEAPDDLNQVDAYEQLHLGEVASGAQAVVFYENGSQTGTVTFERTVSTDGSHNWHMHDVRITAEGPRFSEQDGITVATEDSDGFMNRHMFLKPGDTLATVSSENAARVKTVGTIMTVHLVEVPHEPQRSPVLIPVKPTPVVEFARTA